MSIFKLKTDISAPSGRSTNFFIKKTDNLYLKFECLYKRTLENKNIAENNWRQTTEERNLISSNIIVTKLIRSRSSFDDFMSPWSPGNVLIFAMWQTRIAILNNQNLQIRTWNKISKIWADFWRNPSEGWVSVFSHLFFFRLVCWWRITDLAA